MDTQKRQRVGIIGSIIVHCLVFLLVAFSGVLNVSQAYTDEIVEITMYGGGGGGGGQGDGSDGSIETATDEGASQQAPTDEAPPQADEIWQGDKQVASTPKPQQTNGKPYVKKGTGSGGGVGTGHGTGFGSGIGSGSGSGSGGGHGSGHGTGIGSGYGPGTSVYSAPAVPPRLVYNPSPVYPSAERNAGIQGTAVLRLLVNKNGKVEEITLLSSSGNANLDQAAQKACYKWKFTPARNQAGQIVRCYMSVPITFRQK